MNDLTGLRALVESIRPGVLFLLFAISCHCFADERPVSYSSQIQPILAKHCFACHGPDEAERKGELRLDQIDLAVQQGAIVRSAAAKSPLLVRIRSKDPAEKMPPPESSSLTTKEIDLIRRWIEEGAQAERHWAFVAPRYPRLPSTKIRLQNPIDLFVGRALSAKGLRFAHEAKREALIRRVTFDLTGLPPTIDEVNAFVADRSKDAYERLVDRLLASPRYGERMAVPWLDAARYADTHGYLFDTERSMWRWRDWVIDALNQNKPFDQFTIEQLAGDLLPNATVEQRIASGFNRNHLINNEAGAIPQEYLVENIVDRVNTTSTVWLGLSMGCCQCHDHKYDPFTQKEYYQLYAYFNSIPEVGLDGLNTNAKPLMKAPTESDKQRIRAARKNLEWARWRLAAVDPEIAESQREWEQSLKRKGPLSTKGLASHWTFDNDLQNSVATEPKAVHEAAEVKYEPGVLGEAVALNGLGYVNAGDRFPFSNTDSYTLAAWVRLRTKDGRMSVFSRMDPVKELFRGYTLQFFAGKISFFIVHAFPDDMIQIQGRTSFEPDRWYHVAVTYDGSGKAAGVKLYVDGKLEKPTITIDKLKGESRAKSDFWIGHGHPGAKLKGSVDDPRIYKRVLKKGEIASLPGLSVDSLLAISPQSRNDEQARRVRAFFMKESAKEEHRHRFDSVKRLAADLKKRERSVPTVMVMSRMNKPRETRILQRGAYNKPGAVVGPAIPEVVSHETSSDVSPDRLGLAHWLVDSNHPLTARVQVNRYWQLFFGQGLVRTPGDFGIRGDRPSHPELLDWLARHFIDSGWNVKKLHRLIVTSNTYKQTGFASDQLREADPENRWLARGPRNRLPAEFIRDQALSAGGLLVGLMQGPSVRPYQPEGLWREVAFDFSGGNLTAQVYKPDEGAALYRRSMYTFWKRTAPPPTMLLFDAPDRERCVIKRERTRTPLQALVLLNDPTYVESARGLAQRALNADLTNVDHRLHFAFRAVLTRNPSEEELTILRGVYQRQRKRFSNNEEAAKALIGVGASVPAANVDAAEIAAWTVVSSVLLNLDEAIQK